ncbi:uncharacterized protein Dyak_GE22582 [Drosophila yakuba]|uniref:Uncharacterized protein n=1 Tax=Drosophila yakuba TaxID=7245 RepID=B4PHN3_DROYA|nr:uncharacterized protein Dyak_GE22582 [Drosophila yakuba]
MPGSSHTLQQGHQGSATPPRWSVIEILSRTKPGKRPSRTGGKCLRCQSSDSISSSISNATGSGGESETSVASAQAQSAHSATATTTATTATISTTLPHVPGAATTKNVSLRAVPRIFKRKRDTVQTATTASPLTPQQHPTVAAATSTTTTRRSRLEFILYTEVYQVEEDSVSPSDFNPQSNVGSDDPFWQNYGK